jgi:hypothetical protein
MASPSSSLTKTPSEQGSPTEKPMDSNEETTLKTDDDDRSSLKSEHDSNRDKTEGNDESIDQRTDQDPNPFQGLGGPWTFNAFQGSSMKLVGALTRTAERTADESNVSRFIPSSLKNRLFQRDESSTPIGQAIKGAAMSTARRSVSSMKKLRDTLFKSNEGTHGTAHEHHSDTADTRADSPKAQALRKQRTRSLVSSMVRDITYLAQVAFTEIGATEEMFDNDFKTNLTEGILDTEYNFHSWDRLHHLMSNVKARETLRALMWDAVGAHFPIHSRPLSPIRTLMAESLFHSACSIADFMTSRSSYDPPVSTMTPSLPPDIDDIRLFELRSFRALWQKVLRNSDYVITELDLDNLSAGTRVQGYMCVHPDSILVILMENWEGRPRPQATQEIQRFITREALPIRRGLLESSLVGSVRTVDEADENANRTNDTSIGTERPSTEDADERTDDGSTNSGKSDATIRTTDSQLNRSNPANPIGIRRYLMMSPNLRVELSESPADYVIYLYNKALVYFTGQIQIPMPPAMEEGVRTFYSQSSGSTLGILMTQVSDVAWRAVFKTTVIDYFTLLFPASTYIDLQVQAMVHIPITLAVYATKYALGKTDRDLSTVCMLNVKEFRDIWEVYSEELRLEMTQRINALDTTKANPLQDPDQVKSPPTPLRTNLSTDTLTPPEDGISEAGVKRAFDDLSPITQQEETKRPWRAPDIPFPSMPPPQWSNHCVGWYERNTRGQITWRSRIPNIDLATLPDNLVFIDNHWTGRTLPDGTVFLGRFPCGRPSFGLPEHTDHTRTNPEASRTVPESTEPPTQRPDPVVPTPAPATRSPRQATNESNLKPGAYTPGGTPKILAFHDTVQTYEIPGRQDQEHYYDGDTVDEDPETYQASTVAPLMTRLKYASSPSAFWVPNPVQGSTPVKHWSQGTGVGSTKQPMTIRPDLMHQPHTTPNQGDSGGNHGGRGNFNGPPHYTPSPQPPNGGGNGPPFPPHSGSGGAPPPQGPSSSGSVASSAGGPNRRKRFTCKPDIAAYKEYKAEAGYAAWIEDTVVVMRAQGLGDLLDPNYLPPIGDEEDFHAKQAFTYMMLKKKVLTPTGEQIVANHKTTFDAQAVLYELATEAISSTSAVLSGRALLQKLVASRFDPRSAGATAIKYITTFQRLVTIYNEQQSKPDLVLNDELKKTLLQAGVSTVAILRAVSDREQDSVIRGGDPLSYIQYLTVLKNQATLYDEQYSGRRSANTHDLSINVADGQDPSDSDITNEINEFLVNAMQRRTSGASMNKETWESLSPEGKATWDKMDANDKRLVLQYAKQRADKATTSINTHETSAPEESANSTPETTIEISAAEVHNAVTKARKESHPGDARRVMGSPNGTKKNAQVNHVAFSHLSIDDTSIDDVIAQYWDEDSDSDEDQDF